jgi:hypothetical protein
MTPKNQKLFRGYYRRLLKFYPRPFRERFGESMEQTFDDLCREQKGRTSKMFSLTVHLSVDTGIGIVKEHVLHFSQKGMMKGMLRNPVAAAIVGLLLFLPGAAMVFQLLFGIDPTGGPLRLFGIEASTAPLAGYLQPPDNGPHILGSLIALGGILVLPAIAVLINIAAAERNVLKTTVSDLGIGAIAGAAVTVPLMALEMVLGQVPFAGLPMTLFSILWLMPTTIIVSGAPIARSIRSGKDLFANPVTLFFRAAFMNLIAVFWIGLLYDQMPCFLGVPNCD